MVETNVSSFKNVAVSGVPVDYMEIEGTNKVEISLEDVYFHKADGSISKKDTFAIRVNNPVGWEIIATAMATVAGVMDVKDIRGKKRIKFQINERIIDSTREPGTKVTMRDYVPVEATDLGGSSELTLEAAITMLNGKTPVEVLSLRGQLGQFASMLSNKNEVLSKFSNVTLDDNGRYQVA